ncbi:MULTISPECIES: glycosyltransferase family 4 protein [Acinetobacter]|uniref:glycosyltransferase family 4 protein n=1 Tax=Acinetobacter TaxID=469 RepID=UPI00051B10FF|nr:MULTISPECIES: glycosyltransferase family 4 protein [Acinetobacter]MCH7316958.1 glycosyltransferase family 4 protein [Acinetobacter higginsii]MCH7379675.1 glycosyltransferase family 4 protein [Acinetobacter higginsii]
MSKKKILIVTRNLPPLIGGMERLNWHIADELSKDHDVLLISHTKARTIAPSKSTFYGVTLDPLPLFLILAFIKTFWICLTQRPDILFAGSGLTAPITVFWAKFFRKKSLVYIHGLDIKNDSRIYHLVWTPFIRAANHIITNSSPTRDLCIKKNIPSMKISIIHPGVTFPAKIQNHTVMQEMKEKLNLNNKKILLSVGRLTERKGLSEFIKLSLPQIVKNNPNVILLIVGDSANHALNKNMQTRNQLIKIAQTHNIDQHLCFAGKVTDQELSSLFYLSSIHIFPVKHITNDPEGFGMVAIEAATHGIPTIGFATGGVIDAVEQQKSGFLVESNNYQELSNVVTQFLQKNTLIDRDTCQDYAEKFSWNNMRIKLSYLLDN